MAQHGDAVGLNIAAKKELRASVTEFREAQVQLVNYKKNGDKFSNLLTTIPLLWEADGTSPYGVEVPPRKYIVGFQVDSGNIPGFQAKTSI